MIWKTNHTHTYIDFLNRNLTKILRHPYRRAVASNHNHTILRANRAKIEIDANDGICAEGVGTFAHFGDGVLLALFYYFFVRAGAPADKITDFGEKILEKICADNHFAAHDAKIFHNPRIRNIVGGSYNHSIGINEKLLKNNPFARN